MVSLMGIELSPLTIAMTALVLCVISAIRRYHSLFRVWSEQRIPGPNPWILYREIVPIIRGTFYKTDLERIRQYGTVFAIHDGDAAQLVVADPSILKEMLVRNFASFADRRKLVAQHRIFRKFLTQLDSDEWRQTRSIISPTFTSGKMRSMFPLIQDALQTMVKKVGDGGEFDLKHLFGCLSIDIIARCAFAVDTSAGPDEENLFVYHAKKFFEFSLWKVMLVIFMPEYLRRKFDITFSPMKHTLFIESLVRNLLNERRKMMRDGKGGSKRYNDFLQLLIEAGNGRDDDDEIEHDDSIMDRKDNHAHQRKILTDDEIVSNAMLILIAGYETTASTLTFAAYSLAVNPDIQQRLRDEVMASGELTYASVNKLPYLDAVVNETLRMYPSITRTERKVSDKKGYLFTDGKLGTVHMPHQSVLNVPIYAIHHMEEYFPEPEKFDPERFMPENKDKLIPYTFIPFVMGPRNCVGMRFALLEAKLTLATLVKGYRFVRTEKTPVPLDFTGSVFLLVANNVSARIEKI